MKVNPIELAILLKAAMQVYRSESMRRRCWSWCLPTFSIPKIDARAQLLAGLGRHRLARGMTETLEAEDLILSLVSRALGKRTSYAASGSIGRQKLVDRAKLVLSSDLGRRWTLAEIGSAVGVSPVYLTQVFRQVEGLPLYRYQLQLRLARALDLLDVCSDFDGLGARPRFFKLQPFQYRI